MEESKNIIIAYIYLLNHRGEFLILKDKELGKWNLPTILSLENSIDTSLEKINSEYGLCLNKENSKLIGSKIKYQKTECDIFDTWIFKTNISVTNDNQKWVTKYELLQLKEKEILRVDSFFKEIINNY